MSRRLPAALLWVGLPSPALAQPSTLTIGLRGDPDVLDPTLGSAYVSRIVYASLCDKLIDIDAGLNLVPQLATSWEYEDSTHLVLHLRPGVVFHDGEPFDAEAVRYKIHRDQTIKGSMRAAEVNAVAAAEVVDPLTVRLVLKAPSSPLLSQLADRAGIMISPRRPRRQGQRSAAVPSAPGRMRPKAGWRRTASCCGAFPGIGTRRATISTGSCSGRSRTWRCGWRTCRRAASIWSSMSRRATSRPWSAIRGSRSRSERASPTRASPSTPGTARPPTWRWGGAGWCARRSSGRLTRKR